MGFGIQAAGRQVAKLKERPMSSTDAKAKAHSRSMELSVGSSGITVASDRAGLGTLRPVSESPAGGPTVEETFSDLESVDSDFELQENGDARPLMDKVAEPELAGADSTFSSFATSSLGHRRPSPIPGAERADHVTRRAWSTVPGPRPGSTAIHGAVSLRELVEANAAGSRSVPAVTTTTLPAGDLASLLTRARDHRDVELPDLRTYWR